MSTASQQRIERLSRDRAELDKRLSFAIENEYAHGVVTIGTETAKALLGLMRSSSAELTTLRNERNELARQTCSLAGKLGVKARETRRTA